MKRRFATALLVFVVTVGAYADKPRAVSPEGIAYLQSLRKNTPFGTAGFDLKGLRAGMGARRKPTVKDVKLIRLKIGEIPCEWVLAPGADPDVRLLYLHGGGWVSGSGGNYLPLAADISLAAKCAVLLPDYRLAPEHPFPAGLEDCISAHDWLIANGPSGPGPAKATFTYCGHTITLPADGLHRTRTELTNHLSQSSSTSCSQSLPRRWVSACCV